VAVTADAPVLLTLRASGLGDLLTAVPALRALRRHHPEHRHVLATPAALAPVARMTGAVDATVPAFGADQPRLVPAADAAANLHGSGPESHRTLLASAPRRLLAFRHPAVPASAAGPDWDPTEHDVERWCRMVRHFGIEADPRDLDLDVPDGPLPVGVRGSTVLHPGAAAPARRWPVDRWIALARARAHESHAVTVTVGPGERALGHAIADAVPEVQVVDCSADIELLFRVVAAAAYVVSGDSGVAHVATAVRTPSVVLHGPVAPSRWGPPPDRPWHIPLWSGRSGDPHADHTDAGLLELSVVDVLLALRHLGSYHGEGVRCAS